MVGLAAEELQFKLICSETVAACGHPQRHLAIHACHAAQASVGGFIKDIDGQVGLANSRAGLGRDGNLAVNRGDHTDRGAVRHRAGVLCAAKVLRAVQVRPEAVVALGQVEGDLAVGVGGSVEAGVGAHSFCL